MLFETWQWYQPSSGADLIVVSMVVESDKKLTFFLPTLDILASHYSPLQIWYVLAASKYIITFPGISNKNILPLFVHEHNATWEFGKAFGSKNCHYLILLLI